MAASSPEPTREALRVSLRDVMERLPSEGRNGAGANLVNHNDALAAVGHWFAALPASPGLDVEQALTAIEAMKVSGDERLTPVHDWITVRVVRAILEGRHPILARLATTPEPTDVR